MADDDMSDITGEVPAKKKKPAVKKPATKKAAPPKTLTPAERAAAFPVDGKECKVLMAHLAKEITGPTVIREFSKANDIENFKVVIAARELHKQKVFKVGKNKMGLNTMQPRAARAGKAKTAKRAPLQVAIALSDGQATAVNMALSLGLKVQSVKAGALILS